MLANLLFYSFITSILYGVWKLGRFLYRTWTSPLRRVPGPPSPSLIFGCFKQIQKAETSVLQEQWLAQYGDTITYPVLFGVRRVPYNTLQHITYIFTGPSPAYGGYKVCISPGTRLLTLIVVQGRQLRSDPLSRLSEASNDTLSAQSRRWTRCASHRRCATSDHLIEFRVLTSQVQENNTVVRYGRC